MYVRTRRTTEQQACPHLTAHAHSIHSRPRLKAKKKPLTVLSLANLEMDPLTSFEISGKSTITAVTRRPARTAGTKIIDDGNAGVQLAEFLVAGRLV